MFTVSEDNKQLKMYLEHFGKFVKTPKGNSRASPNFSRLSMSGLPRGSAGRKGAKAPRKKAIKRRKIVSEENYADIVRSLTFDSDDENNDSRSGNGASGSCGPLQNTNWGPPRPPYIGYPDCYSYYGNPFYNQSYYGLSRYASPSYPFAADNSNPKGTTTQPFRSDTYLEESNTSAQLPAHSAASCPFFIKLLNNRIKVCAGCKGAHMKDANGQLLPSPNNLCIGHKEALSFINPKTGLDCAKEGNCYYHINRACIIKKTSSLLTISSHLPK